MSLWEVSVGDQSQAANTREEEAEVKALCTLCQHLSAFGLGKVLPFPPNLTREGLGALVMAGLMSNTTQAPRSGLHLLPTGKHRNIRFSDKSWLDERVCRANPCCEGHLAVNL